jgi:pyruvate dehydrogenase E2 component (dihydrolipoamide acetyltransferase)
VLVTLRDGARKSAGNGTEIELPYAALFVRVAAKALEEPPSIRARLAGNEIRIPGRVNVGLAVDARQGLVVPVVRSSNMGRLKEIIDELMDLIQLAQIGKLLPDDLFAGTFTITNLGISEIDAFTLIIDPPQIAILGIGHILPQPVAGNGKSGSATWPF